MKNKFKARLSVEYFGKFNFSIGLLLAIASSFLLKIFFSGSAESLRYLNYLTGNLMQYSNTELFFIETFMGCLSSTLGLCIVLIFLLSNLAFQKKRNSRRKYLFALSSLNLTLWFTLMAIGRMLSTLGTVLYSNRGYDSELNFLDSFGFVYILIPVLIFLQAWMPLQLIYRCSRWVMLSAAGCLILGLVLSQVRPIDSSILNNKHYKVFQEEIDFLDATIIQAENEYQFKFSKEALHVLKSNRTPRSIQQVRSIKNAFQSERVISLDTILMNKIIIHNAKRDRFGYSGKIKWEDWVYSTPLEILRQINFHQSNSLERKELFKCLEELKLLSEFIGRKRKKDQTYSFWERRKMMHPLNYDISQLSVELEMVQDSISGLRPDGF